MTKEVEDIIKNKAFTELTMDERQRVGELAQNEAEYTEMQWFLLAATRTFESSKVAASPKMKRRVMEHLSSVGDKKGFWLNSVGLFMLPKDEPIHKKPLVQLGLAAALIIGFLAYYNQTIPEDTLALNESTQEDIKREMPTESIEPFESTNLQNRSEQLETKEMELDADEVEKPTLLKLNDEVGIGQYKDAVMAEPSMDAIERIEDVPSPANSEFAGDVATEIAEERSKVTSNKRNDIVVDAMLKEDENQLEKRMEMSDAEEVVASETFVSSPGATSDGLFATGSNYAASAQDQIIPKSLHIDRTKELNQLFFIVK